MTDQLDQLKSAVGAATDLELAVKLGLDRSTIAQWRRRGGVPARYSFMLDPERWDSIRQGVRHAERRLLYGDSHGRYMLAAALGLMPSHALDFPPELSAGNIGFARESRIISVLEIVTRVCVEVLGKARCENDGEFLTLMNAIRAPGYQATLQAAFEAPAVGEP